MDIYQLKTFVIVAREGSITRASELLHLSQPAVSAHIKAIEDALGLAVFERTPRGMSLTREGERLLTKAEQTLSAHQALMDEATRIKGRLSGTFRIGACSNSKNDALGKLLTLLAQRCPEVDVVLKHGTSLEIVSGVRNGSLDAGFYNEPSTPAPGLLSIEVSHFSIFLVAAPGVVPASKSLDWQALAGLPWVYPTSSACCGQTAERLFAEHQIRPQRIVSVDRQDVTRTLIASGLGVGLLHAEMAKEAQSRGEVELIFESPLRVRVLFAHLASRAEDPLLLLATAILSATPDASREHSNS